MEDNLFFGESIVRQVRLYEALAPKEHFLAIFCSLLLILCLFVANKSV